MSIGNYSAAIEAGAILAFGLESPYGTYQKAPQRFVCRGFAARVMRLSAAVQTLPEAREGTVDYMTGCFTVGRHDGVTVQRQVCVREKSESSRDRGIVSKA